MAKAARKKVVLQGYLLVPGAELSAVLVELPRHIALTLAEEGCSVFVVQQDSENRCKFHVYEEFVDKAAFAVHQARVRDSQWGLVSVNAERHYQVGEMH